MVGAVIPNYYAMFLFSWSRASVLSVTGVKTYLSLDLSIHVFNFQPEIHVCTHTHNIHMHTHYIYIHIHTYIVNGSICTYVWAHTHSLNHTYSFCHCFHNKSCIYSSNMAFILFQWLFTWFFMTKFWVQVIMDGFVLIWIFLEARTA